MTPDLSINVPAIAVSVVACFVFSFLWYGPLFGKVWAKLVKVSMDKKPSFKGMMKPMGIQLLGTVLTVFVLSRLVVLTKGAWASAHEAPCGFQGVCLAFGIWLGFYLPMAVSPVLWERKPWKLFFLNATYYFLNLQLATAILSCWG